MSLAGTNAQQLFLPARAASALNGTQVIDMLSPLTQTVREDSIFSQVMSGNIPDFMRNLVEVSDTEMISSQPVIIRYYVIPDYLALGCDSDYFLCPMTPLLAQKICDYTSCILPTRKMVNQIWLKATCKLSPQTIPPSGAMVTVPVFADHDSMVWNSRSAVLAAHPLGELVGGDKKDVILSNQIYGHPAPGRVVIYGWHYLSGTPIQPLYYGHEETYADYSHGIRLVLSDMFFGDSLVRAEDVLASATNCVLLSDEGVISIPRYPVAADVLSSPKSFAVFAGDNSVNVSVRPVAPMRGYKITASFDAAHFSLPDFFTSANFSFSDFSADSIVYIRLASIGANGGVSPYSEVLCATVSGVAPLSDQWLIVNGFDRATTVNSYDFVRFHAPGLMRLPGTLGVSSCSNEAITDTIVQLTDFRAVDFLLGEESSLTESYNSAEQSVVADFMSNGGKLFVSGSEIGWDLGHLGTSADSAFYSQVLHASYIDDAPGGLASAVYSFNAVPGTFSFDDGSHGLYNVAYPDVVAPSDTNTAEVQLIGTYAGYPSSGCGVFVEGSLVYLAVPFETIYPAADAALFLGWVNEILFPSTVGLIQNEQILTVLPNPVSDFFVINLVDSDARFELFDISGRKQPAIFEHVSETAVRADVSSLANGMYIVTCTTASGIQKCRILISH
ncbi:hypothetical protein SDC9_49207 [bioreactor metagenome]|uniref:Secretion system C-terminal sorting domain-containing protein n=1 Tax=bioreactor metagenome TaxID=1076179 RepID=A0A644WHG9_9ZZZZ